jgi:hypothetical protein
MAAKRHNTVRSPRPTYRKRQKAPVKNAPQVVRPLKPEIVYVYADEILDHLYVEPSNDNVPCF